MERKKKKILVIDDQEACRLLPQEELQLDGYEVVTSEEGHRAVELIRRHKPDLMTIDVQAPWYDGFDVMKAVKALYPELPVILHTGHTIWDVQEDPRFNFADAFVTKSFDLTELKNKIALLLVNR